MTWCIHSTQKIKDINYSQLISDPSTYVKKRAQRSDDSILLRHLDDVVGTGPEEHLMSYFEHQSVFDRCDTVNFLVFRSPKTRKGLDSTDLVESLLKLYGLQNSEPTSQSWWTLDSDGACVSNSTGWSRLLQLFAQPSENSSSWHLGDQTCNSPSNNYPHKS